MKRQIALIINLIIISQFAVIAQVSPKKTPVKHTVSPQKHIYAKKHTYHRVHRVDNRPEVTLDSIKNIGCLWGIDVSHHQPFIDWEVMSNDKPDFMFIKATEGTTIQDSKYETYYAEAKKLGIPVGSYHFFSYKCTGKEQADKFLSTIQYQSGDMLPVLDAEYTRSIPKNKIKVMKELTSFVNTVYEKLGIYPIIYCNYFYSQKYFDQEILKKCKLWIANYKAKPTCEYHLWQATNKGKLDSVKGLVDLNFFNGDKDALQELIYPPLPPLEAF
jgi:lysozyme